MRTTMRDSLTRIYGVIILLAVLIGVGPTASLLAQGYSTGNNYYWVPPGACSATFSGGGAAAGTNGLTVNGASLTPVIQVQTDNASTNTHIYNCNIAPPGYLVTSGLGIQIVSATFMYGVQTTGLGTQVAVLASGTMNALPVFSYIDFPAAGAAETPSTVTPVRADSGTLTITPVVGSFNVATTTAGSYYSATFTPASGTLVLKTIRRQLLMRVALLNTATSATITNSPGILINYRSQTS